MGKSKILVVDDEVRNLSLMEALLVPLGYEVILAGNGEEALEKVQLNPPDLILLDIMMPGLDGFEVTRRLKENEETKGIPIVTVTVLEEVEDRVRALEAGADDFLHKPVDKMELKARVHSLLKVKAFHDHMLDHQKILEEEVTKRTGQLRAAFEKVKKESLASIYRLSKASEYKDEDIGAHIQRMSNYSAAVARKLGLNETTVETILYASPMHDVGKIGIPDHILLKPGKLEPDEWESMKRHVTIGAGILKGSDSAFIKLGRTIALTHHEKWDGSGYPEGLRDEKIPLAGRITALADVFDALTSRRPYKEPYPLETALEIIKKERGGHFDPAIVDIFMKHIDDIVKIKDEVDAEEKAYLSDVISDDGHEVEIQIYDERP